MTSAAPFAHHSETLSVRGGRRPAIQRSVKPKFFIARAAAPMLPASCGSTRTMRRFTLWSLDALALAAGEEALVPRRHARRVFFECLRVDDVDPSRGADA